jgi:hypothetical protein
MIEKRRYPIGEPVFGSTGAAEPVSRATANQVANISLQGVIK